MLERLLGSCRATYPLLMLTLIFYGLLDSLTTIFCFYIANDQGYNALSAETSPLISSGIFGSDWRSVIFSKVFIVAVIFLHLYILSQYQRLTPVVNACLITMTIFGAFATVNNISIILGSEEITVFHISPLMISSILSSVILLFGFYIFIMRMKNTTNTMIKA
jgi:hypothetical protein